jgi:hypothetical protein
LALLLLVLSFGFDILRLSTAVTNNLQLRYSNISYFRVIFLSFGLMLEWRDTFFMLPWLTLSRMDSFFWLSQLVADEADCCTIFNDSLIIGWYLLSSANISTKVLTPFT